MANHGPFDFRDGYFICRVCDTRDSYVHIVGKKCTGEQQPTKYKVQSVLRKAKKTKKKKRGK